MSKNKISVVLVGTVVLVAIIAIGSFAYLSGNKSWSCQHVKASFTPPLEGSEALEFNVINCTKNTTTGEFIFTTYTPQNGLLPHQIKGWKTQELKEKSSQKAMKEYKGDVPVECEEDEKDNSDKNVVTGWSCK